MKKVLLLLLASSIALPTFSQASVVYKSDEASFTVESVIQGLEHPWSMAWLPDGRLLVTERPGRLRLWDGTRLSSINGVPEVLAEGQGGLLEVLVDPDFTKNGFIYLSYAHAEKGLSSLRVARARLAEGALSGLSVLWDQEPRSAGRIQYGGRLAFLPDGTLLISTGDRGQENRSQDPGDGAGKLVRINPDGSIPKDNPFASLSGPQAAFWSLGHRNIQGLAVRPRSSEIWATEHGPKGGDELNLVRAGKNYGWPIITYGLAYSGAKIGIGSARAGLEQPIIYWSPSPAPSGLSWYSGKAFPGWKGNLFSGNLAGQVLIRIVLDGDAVVAQERLLQGKLGRIRDVRQGPDGFIYLATDEAAGRVLRLVPAR